MISRSASTNMIKTPPATCCLPDELHTSLLACTTPSKLTAHPSPGSCLPARSTTTISLTFASSACHLTIASSFQCVEMHLRHYGIAHAALHSICNCGSDLKLEPHELMRWPARRTLLLYRLISDGGSRDSPQSQKATVSLAKNTIPVPR